jgi:hypothetical protein
MLSSQLHFAATAF